MDELNAFGLWLQAFTASVWFDILCAAVAAAFISLILYLIYLRMARSLIDKIQYTRTFSQDGVYAGEGVTLTECIYNNSFIPLFFVSVEGYIYNELVLEEYEPDKSVAMQFFRSSYRLIMPFMQIKRHHKITCPLRGYYRLESVDVFFRRQNRHVPSPAAIYVYPAMLPCPNPPFARSATQGESMSPLPLIPDPFSLSGVRDYRSGDPFNMINFKATAHTGGFSDGKIKVNQRDFCANRVFMVYIDLQTSVDSPIPTPIYNKAVETALSMTAYLLREASKRGFCAGFSINCVTDGEPYLRYPPGAGNLYFNGILRALSALRAEKGLSFGGLLDIDIAARISDSEIYIMTFVPDAELDGRIRLLRTFNNSVSIIDLRELCRDNRDDREEEAAS